MMTLGVREDLLRGKLFQGADVRHGLCAADPWPV